MLFFIRRKKLKRRKDTITCSSFWKYVGTIFNKKLLKKDVRQLLRIDSNTVSKTRFSK